MPPGPSRASSLQPLLAANSGPATNAASTGAAASALPPTADLQSQLALAAVPPTATSMVTPEDPILDELTLTLLGDAPRNDVEMGLPSHRDISLRWLEIIAKGFQDDTIKAKILAEYPIPSNLDKLVPPILNAKVVSALATTPTLIKRDYALQQRQKQIGIILAALSKTLNYLLCDKSLSAPESVIKPVSDASRLLCQLFHKESRTRRSFIISHGNVRQSQIKNISRGCPQGSILSPLLFIMYTSDLITNLRHCKVHLYADDTQLYYSFDHRRTDEAVQRINSDLDLVYNWTKRNSLVLNPSKSKFMVLGTKQQCEQITKKSPQIIINSKTVERVSTARNLGLQMDEQLKFVEHINQKIRTAFFRLKVLYGIRDFLKVDVRVTLTESLILSIFNYCDCVYGPRIFEKTSRAIQRVQNACTRFCFGIPKRSHITPYLTELKILKMEGRRKLHLASLVHKVVHTKKPKYLHDKFEWLGDAHNKDTRSKVQSKMAFPSHKTANFRSGFRFAASKIWNDLPPPLQQNMSSYCFKFKLKSFLINKQIELTENLYIISKSVKKNIKKVTKINR